MKLCEEPTQGQLSAAGLADATPFSHLAPFASAENAEPQDVVVIVLDSIETNNEPLPRSPNADLQTYK